jgi:hypothetical protein
MWADRNTSYQGRGGGHGGSVTECGVIDKGPLEVGLQAGNQGAKTVKLMGGNNHRACALLGFEDSNLRKCLCETQRPFNQLLVLVRDGTAGAKDGTLITNADTETFEGG